MAEIMSEEDTIPVSDEVNRCITVVAGRVQGEISDLDKNKVSRAIE